ncbi:MAG: SseB family protein [Paracoccaceae bacterium]
MTETPLDRAHSAMQTAPEDDAARLGFYERLADSELFLLLEAEAGDADIRPAVFELEETACVLAFDRQERLAEFTDTPTPFVALSGRSLAEMLAGHDLGLGLNLGVAPSAILLPAEAVSWLHETLSHAPTEIEARPVEILPPSGLPDSLVAGLDLKLAAAAGLARFAYLAKVEYSGSVTNHMLAFIDPVPGAEGALAQAGNEALLFSGIEAGQMDISFFNASDPMAAKLARVGLRFDLPEAPANTAQERAAPGSDPDKPPRLR